MDQRPSLAGRAVMAVLLTVGFYGFALGLAAVIGWFLYADFQSGHVHGRLLIAGGITIAVILWSVTPRIDRFPDPGVQLHEPRQPELFRLIAELAQATGQGMPAEVFLVGDVNAFVAQRGGMLGFGSRRVMGIGLPLLEVLTIAQLRAVLSHEFGHFHGGDTKLGPWIYKTRSAIIRTVQNFARVGSWLRLPFQWYANLFLRITQAISRRQELAADALSVQVAGAGPVRSALSTVAEIAPLYHHYLGNEFTSIINGGVRPPVAEGFRRFLASPSIAKVRAEVASAALAAKADPFDTHPPLSERLAAVGGKAERRDAGEPVAAITLLRDLPALERDLLVFMSGDPAIGRLPTASWDEGPGLALPKIWRAITFDHCVNLPELKVADLVAQRERLDELARQLQIQGGEPEQRRAHAAALLGNMLAFRLHTAGFQVLAHPGHPIKLVHGSVVIEPLGLLDPVDQGGLTDSVWRQRCAGAGIGGLPLAGKSTRPPTRE